MDKLMIDSAAFKLLEQKVDRIYEFVKAQEKNEAASEWLTTKEACQMMEVSERTMQRLRSKGKISYSIRGGKVRYRRFAIIRAMNGREIIEKPDNKVSL